MGEGRGAFGTGPSRLFGDARPWYRWGMSTESRDGVILHAIAAGAYIGAVVLFVLVMLLPTGIFG